jgi:hypothetical protein
MSLDRERLRLAAEVRGAEPLDNPRLRLALRLPGLHHDPAPTRAEACDPDDPAARPRLRACERWLARLRAQREGLPERSRIDLVLAERDGDVPAVVRRDGPRRMILEAELPTEQLPETAEAPLAELDVRVELRDRERGAEDVERRLDVVPPVAFGAIPALLHRAVSGEALYRPGPRTGAVAYIPARPSFAWAPLVEQEHSIAPRVLVAAGERRLAAVQLAPTEPAEILVLEGEDVGDTLAWGTVAAHGPVGAGYGVVVQKNELVGWHFMTYRSVEITAVWLDRTLASPPAVTRAQAICREWAAPRAAGPPRPERVLVSLSCKSGGGDSDVPETRAAPALAGVSWDATKQGYEAH